MKRFLLPAFLLAVFFLAGRFWGELGVTAAGQGSGAACAGNGDVNGDGERDMSDAIALLRWLFLGDKEPVACADGPGPTAEQLEILSHLSIVQLPDGKGGTTKTIRLTGANFQIVNGLGNTDSINGLGNLIVGYQELRSGVSDNDRRGSHSIVVGSSQNYTKEATGGLVAGYHNTIAAFCATVTGGSQNVASGIESASVSGGKGNTASGAGASVSGGRSNTADRDYEILGDSFSKPRFVDNGDGTVSDNRTGLMWQKATDPTKRKWIDARSYCENLTLSGHSNWRMPSYAELESILDETRSSPAIDPVFEAVSDWYWSSSAFISSGTAWIVGFNVGGAGSGGVDVPGYVRAVRSGP